MHLFGISILSVIFFAKREISFEVSTFGGSLFSGESLLSGFANTCDVNFYRYFWTFAIFVGSLLSELYGKRNQHNLHPSMHNCNYLCYHLKRILFRKCVFKTIQNAHNKTDRDCKGGFIFDPTG